MKKIATQRTHERCLNFRVAQPPNQLRRARARAHLHCAAPCCIEVRSTSTMFDVGLSSGGQASTALRALAQPASTSLGAGAATTRCEGQTSTALRALAKWLGWFPAGRRWIPGSGSNPTCSLKLRIARLVCLSCRPWLGRAWFSPCGIAELRLPILAASPRGANLF